MSYFDFIVITTARFIILFFMCSDAQKEIDGSLDWLEKRIIQYEDHMIDWVFGILYKFVSLKQHCLNSSYYKSVVDSILYKYFVNLIMSIPIISIVWFWFCTIFPFIWTCVKFILNCLIYKRREYTKYIRAKYFLDCMVKLAQFLGVYNLFVKLYELDSLVARCEYQLSLLFINAFSQLKTVFIRLRIKHLLLIISIASFFFWSMLWLTFDPLQLTYQHVFCIRLFNMCIYLGFDGISLLFLFLTSSVIPLCILFNWNNQRDYITEYLISLVCIELLLFLVFTVTNILLFYIFFELILIPFFIMIGFYGSRTRKIHASYLLFFYTLFGSVLMLISILFLYLHSGSTNYHILFGTEFSSLRESFLWFAFFLSFGIKIPIYPFHIWLPEAHVESPTEGSVILAAILLKVGGYGFYRILFPIFPSLTLYFSSLAIVFCSISIIYTSFTTLRQVDIKRIIAYSSISHMNIALIGFFGFNAISISGSFILMLGHGFVSGGLFFMIGMLYNRFKTKFIKYYSGLVYVMPIFSSFFFIFLLGNISLPTTCNFLGEFLVLVGLVQNLNFIGIYSICLSIFFCSFYTLYVFNRITFGLPNKMFRMKDLSVLEVSLLIPLVFFIFFVGIYPKPILDIIFLSALKMSIISW